jgi:hypothetical protein
MIHITLPWPPSVNGYWRKWRGRMVISVEGRKVPGGGDQAHLATRHGQAVRLQPQGHD